MIFRETGVGSESGFYGLSIPKLSGGLRRKTKAPGFFRDRDFYIKSDIILVLHTTTVNHPSQ